MGLAARKTLADCEVAHGLLKNEKSDSPSWRVHWVSCLTLLRAVGHVLAKVDGAADEKHRKVIDAKWIEWKSKKDESAIFWNFIEAERNNLLKQYKFGVEPEPNFVVDNEGNQLVTNEGEAIVTEDDYFRLSLVGLENKEGRDAIDEAIKWWSEQLAAIEEQLPT